MRLPLREKTFNSEQFSAFTASDNYNDRERSKTRKQLKIEIINSKPEITPLVKMRKKAKEWKCLNIIK